MKIAIGCDHIVTDIKIKAAEFLKKQGHEVIDVGTHDFIRTHYPIYGRKVGVLVAKGDVDLGVCICGTGIGINNSAQKIKGVRAACVTDVQTAVAAKEQLNANVIGCGGLDAFLKAKYQPTPERDALIQKIDNMIPDNDAIENDHIFDEYNKKWAEGYYHD